ncbi:MAG: ABC-2 transporter permease [Lachnospiraceae bacterium]|nr:ABC-2 transporter permease [Lachnospiraceae bacterium]
MIGLLYKDFVMIRGKKMAWILGIVTLAFIVLRVIFSGSRAPSDMIVYDDNGNVVNALDIFFVTAVISLMIICVGTVINASVMRICSADEKNKTRAYLFSGPLTRRGYVASKYLFVLGLTLSLLALSGFWAFFCKTFMTTNSTNDGFMKIINSFAVPFYCFALVIAALELPVFLLLGRDKAMLVKIGLIMLIGMFVIAYLLFGDLDVFEKIDFDRITRWIAEHVHLLKRMNIIAPIVGLIAMGISFGITALLYGRKERDFT